VVSLYVDEITPQAGSRSAARKQLTDQLADLLSGKLNSPESTPAAPMIAPLSASERDAMMRDADVSNQGMVQHS
jgi:hypothetical protein